MTSQEANLEIVENLGNCLEDFYQKVNASFDEARNAISQGHIESAEKCLGDANYALDSLKCFIVEAKLRLK